MAEYYMFNKPRGCISARRDQRHKTVMDYFPEEIRSTHFPIGRLDKDTEGLLIITSDGKLAHKLLSPEHHIPKKYFFYAQGEINEEKLAELCSGVSIYRNRTDKTAPAKIEIGECLSLRDIKDYLDLPDTTLATRRGDLPVFSGFITITEGKNHQVKRMIRYAGARVVYLKRVSMGRLPLDPSLEKGESRPLTSAELSILAE